MTAKTTVRSAEAPEPPPPSPEPEPPAEEPPPSDDKAEEETDPEERIRAWIEDYYDCPDRESKGEDYWQDEDHRNSHGGESAHH
ncbi:hypothetical protein [Allosalinactinospora lopnorensis]|uniref:hypothetical protein n=1 Tax=Allosalinactinospora lopnorensis TaxID=1352348 RepID=UPI000623C0BA|nr:hypothetical protein [Allosalinactinospora lopnorensis]